MKVDCFLRIRETERLLMLIQKYVETCIILKSFALTIADEKEPSPGDNTTRYVIKTEEHIQVVFYDHLTRRKT
jgi:hypothetical protein